MVTLIFYHVYWCMNIILNSYIMQFFIREYVTFVFDSEILVDSIFYYIKLWQCSSLLARMKTELDMMFRSDSRLVNITMVTYIRKRYVRSHMIVMLYCLWTDLCIQVKSPPSKSRSKSRSRSRSRGRSTGKSSRSTSKSPARTKSKSPSRTQSKSPSRSSRTRERTTVVKKEIVVTPTRQSTRIADLVDHEVDWLTL